MNGLICVQTYTDIHGEQRLNSALWPPTSLSPPALHYNVLSPKEETSPNFKQKKNQNFRQNVDIY